MVLISIEDLRQKGKRIKGFYICKVHNQNQKRGDGDSSRAAKPLLIPRKWYV